MLKSPLTDHYQSSNITTTTEDGSFQLTQTELINSIFTEFEKFLPMSNRRNRVPLNRGRQPGNSDPFDRKQYLHLLGMLDYLLQRRPEVTTVASFASMKVSNPTHDHYLVALDVVNKYLWQAKDIGLIIHPNLFLHRVRRPWSILLQNRRRNNSFRRLLPMRK